MALVLFSSAPFHSRVGCKRGSWCPCGRSNNSDLCHFLMLESQRNYDIEVRGRSPCCQFLGGRAGWRSGNPASKSFCFRSLNVVVMARCYKTFGHQPPHPQINAPSASFLAV